MLHGARGASSYPTEWRLPAEWTTYRRTFPVGPTTLEPWTVASVDALEIGARNAMSPRGPDGVQLTQRWMVVGYTP